MKTLIVYMSTHGFTELIVNELKNKINGEIELVNLKKVPNPILSGFERVLIGGSIHMGQIQIRVKKFCEKNLDELLEKEIGLFISCMEKNNIAKEQLINAFPNELFNKAKSTEIFGGKFDFNKMNYFQKKIVRKVAKIKKTTVQKDDEAISRFISVMNN